MRIIIIIAFSISVYIANSEMEFINFFEKNNMYPKGELTIYDDVIYTFLDSNLIRYDTNVEIVRKNSAWNHGFYLNNHDDIVLSVDSSVVYFKDGEWSNVDEFELNSIFSNSIASKILKDTINECYYLLPSMSIMIFKIKNDSIIALDNSSIIDPNYERLKSTDVEFFKGKLYWGSLYLHLSEFYVDKLAGKLYNRFSFRLQDVIYYPDKTLVTSNFDIYRNKMWFAANDGMIYSFDGDEFERHDFFANINEPFADLYHIVNIKWDHLGNLWAVYKWIVDKPWYIFSDYEVIKFNKKDDFKTYRIWEFNDFEDPTGVLGAGDKFNIEIDQNNPENKKVYIQTYQGILIYEPDISSVKKGNENVSFNISPNPVQDQLRIENYEIGINHNIEIYNVLSEKVLTANISEINSINVSNLTPGVYFIKIGDKVEKFVKE
jgi:hypothetical protein